MLIGLLRGAQWGEPFPISQPNWINQGWQKSPQAKGHMPGLASFRFASTVPKKPMPSSPAVAVVSGTEAGLPPFAVVGGVGGAVGVWRLRL